MKKDSGRTSRLGVLTTHTEPPVMTETTVSTDFLQTLEIITELRVDGVREDLGVLPVGDVFTPVQEPCRDLVLGRVLEDSDDALEFIGVHFTSTNVSFEVGVSTRRKISGKYVWMGCAPFVQVNICLLADNVRITPSDTLNLR